MRSKLLIIYIVLILYSCKNSNTNKYKDDPFKNENEYEGKFKQIIPYCKILVSEKFLLFLSKNKGKNPKEIYSNACKEFDTQNEVVFFSMFIGGAIRNTILKSQDERSGSDDSWSYDLITPYFYTERLTIEMLYYEGALESPGAVVNYYLNDDTLINKVNDNDYLSFTLCPINKKLSNNEIWILNGNTRMVDISYLKEKIKCDIQNIDRFYFTEIIERLMDEKCGYRNDFYTMP